MLKKQINILSNENQKYHIGCNRVKLSAAVGEDIVFKYQKTGILTETEVLNNS